MTSKEAFEAGYNAGFDNGAAAIVQQVDAIIYESIASGEAVRRIERLIEDFWKERES